MPITTYTMISLRACRIFCWALVTAQLSCIHSNGSLYPILYDSLYLLYKYICVAMITLPITTVSPVTGTSQTHRYSRFFRPSQRHIQFTGYKRARQRQRHNREENTYLLICSKHKNCIIVTCTIVPVHIAPYKRIKFVVCSPPSCWAVCVCPLLSSFQIFFNWFLNTLLEL